MATKTITITTEAYSKLKKTKRPGESFSDVINRTVRAPVDYREWLRRIESLPPMDEAAAKVIEEQLNVRRKSFRKAS